MKLSDIFAGIGIAACLITFGFALLEGSIYLSKVAVEQGWVEAPSNYEIYKD